MSAIDTASVPGVLLTDAGLLSSPAVGDRRPSLRGWFGSRGRSVRVVALVTAATLLGLADLAMTMTYLLHVGMFESNPVARLVINSGSPAVVIGFKLGTMLVTSWIVLANRRRWQAELVAWLSVVVLTSLFVHWIGYIEYAEVTTSAISIVAADPSYASGEWVSLR